MLHNSFFHWIAISVLVTGLVSSGCSQASNPENGSNRERAEALIQRAGQSFAGGDFRKNVDLLKEAAAIDPQNVKVWWKLCEAYQVTEELDLAVKACEQRLTLDPSHIAHNSLGLVYLAKKDYAKAASEFERAAANTDDTSFYSNYVWSLLCSKQYAKAVPAALRLLELSEDNPQPDTPQDAYERLGVAYSGMGQNDAARDAFRKAGCKSCEMGEDEKHNMVLRCVGQN
jgi:Tfp pilus assembly protein PilF